MSQDGSGYRAGDDGAMIAVADLFSNHAAEDATRDDRYGSGQTAATAVIGRVIVVIDDSRRLVMVNMAMYHARRPVITWRRLVVMVNHSRAVMIMAVVMMSMIVVTVVPIPMIVVAAMMAVAPMVAVGARARCKGE